MTEVSGQPIVNKSDSTIASYLKPQDYFMNPPTSTWSFDTRAIITLNSKDTTPSSGGIISGGGAGSLNIAQAFTTSGRTITAAGSGVYAPLGYFAIQVSGSTVVVPFFSP